ncbi:hypothetical protein AX774_g7826 [Zancudomyces culisetae]|nr:hypothetical protein AX774_g7826 [Zancudomyces culisetae]|eukprot:OMH78773.1 hypothetical protein AX774_g7826 [Zancudomyces culisetae]
MFCCDTSVQGSCKWGVVQTNALTLNISVRAGGEFYKLIKGQLNSGLVSTTTFTMNINMEVNPGRCKWVDIGTTRLNRRAEGECCWWGVSWLCSKDSTEWHRTSTNAMYAMKETDYRNGKIGRGVPIIVEEGMVTGVQEPDLADFTTSS